MACIGALRTSCSGAGQIERWEPRFRIMLLDCQKLIENFANDVKKYCGITIFPGDITHDCWVAPHKCKDLPKGCGAVYIFSLASISAAPAGGGRVLKVGKAGASSNPRFRYQHYSEGSAQSTLAGAIRNNPLLWGYISFPGATVDIGEWLRNNTDRNNFYFQKPELIGLFEVYAKANLGPVFEGSLSSKS